ncbi:hypothetical protein DPMN_061838 [Dreissena polymorpha]|uniref:Uncharacterized protein n=1 Tax=Dreissena polymorpha TaxID=45954 RepID=A0A9D4C8J2_DREPO|nr:hypothetical protein DPMN_061838 [Dreissena polymorpha]
MASVVICTLFGKTLTVEKSTVLLMEKQHHLKLRGIPCFDVNTKLGTAMKVSLGRPVKFENQAQCELRHGNMGVISYPQDVVGVLGVLIWCWSVGIYMANRYAEPYSCYGDVCNEGSDAQFCDVVLGTVFCSEHKLRQDIEKIRVGECQSGPPKLQNERLSCRNYGNS